MTQLTDFSRDLITAAASLTRIRYEAPKPGGNDLAFLDAFDAIVEFEPIAGPRYHVHDLSLLARLAASCRDTEALAGMARGGGLTCLIVPEADQRRLVDLASSAIQLWSDDGGLPTLRDLKVLRADAETSVMHHAITTAWELGRGVLLLSGECVPDLLRPVVEDKMPLPPLSSPIVAAMLAITHGAEPLMLDMAPLTGLDLGAVTPLALTKAFTEETPQNVIARLATLAAQTAQVATGITLDRVHGLSDAMPALQRMARDLERWKAGDLDWSDATASALFYGPPGTGKSMAATALAGSAGVPLIMITYGDAQKAGHLGDTMREMSAAFDRAIAAAPCVLFLEEIDGYGSRDSKDGSGNSYRRAVVTHLLQLLDKARRVPGLVIVGCTNHLDAIDPAIRRSGRFDLTLKIGLPDRKGLIAILQDLLPNVAFDVAPMADRLIGCTGADAAAAVREAQSLARDAKEPLGASHLHAALDRIAPRIAPMMLRRAAVHEAGHILVTHLLRQPTPARAVLSVSGGQVDYPRPPIETYDSASVLLRILLAGRAAEIVALGDASSGAGHGAVSDMALATTLALRMELQWGMGDCGLIYAPLPDATRIPAWLHAKLRSMLDEAQAEAIDLLRAHRDSLERIAAALLSERELDGAALAQLMPPQSSEPVAANDNVIPFPGRRQFARAMANGALA